MRLIKILLVLLISVVATGCATILNPYNEDFSCPETYNGKCVSIAGAYDESVTGVAPDEKQERKVTCDCWDEEDCDCEPVMEKEKKVATPEPAQKPRSAAIEYRESLYGKLARLLKEPVTPIVAPPKVMRVLLLPYEGSDNALYMYRYVYFFAEEPKWILDEVVAPPEEKPDALQ